MLKKVEKVRSLECRCESSGVWKASLGIPEKVERMKEKRNWEENDGVPEGNVDRKGGVAKSEGKGIGE